MAELQTAQQDEEIVVLFHAALLGRTDVVQNAIATIRGKGDKKLSDKEVSAIISTGRAEDNATPLHIAAAYGHTDVIRALLNAGADLSATARGGEYDGLRPYEAAATEATKSTFHVFLFERLALGDAAAIERLLSGGIAVDWADDSAARNSTLHWASSFGNTAVAEILLQHGCAVDVLNAVQQTPLHLACKDANLEVIQLLLDEGANPIRADIDGRTPADLIPAPKATTTTSPATTTTTTGAINGTNSATAAVVVIESSADRIKQLLASAPVDPPRRCYQKFLQRQQQEQQRQLKALEEQQKQQQQQQQQQEVNATVEGDEELVAHRNALLYSKIDINLLDFDANTAVNNSNNSNNNNSNHNSNNSNSSSNVLLIFWPPVKQQSCSTALPPLLLRSDEHLLICVGSADIDVFPLLTWSGLMDAMDSFGFQVQVKRSSLGARLRLSIDSNLCPGRNSYSLQVGREQIQLLAADATGLLYGVYTLIQLLQLHSDVHHSNDTNNSSSSSGSNSNGSNTGQSTAATATTTAAVGVTTVAVPPVTIRDSPDIADRAVLWSYRQHVRISSTRMRAHVELLSRFRINQLHLVVDMAIDTTATTTSTSTNAANAANAAATAEMNNGIGKGGNIGSNGSSNRIADNSAAGIQRSDPSAATKVYALDEVCKRHCVTLVPTIIIDSIHARLPLDVLKNFSSPLISLVFAFEPRRAADEIAAFAAAVSASQFNDSNSDSDNNSNINGHNNSNGNNIVRGNSNSSTNGNDISSGGSNNINRSGGGQLLLAADDVAAAVKEACDRIFKDVHLTGASSVTFSCSAWTAAAADPAGLASDNGLNAVEREFSFAFPSSLFCKPIISAQSYINDIYQYTSRVLESSTSTAVFPAMMDRDFMFPSLFVKYYCFMFGGFAWNSASIVDMLGDPAAAEANGFNARIIREVLCLLLFNTKADIAKDAFKVIMTLMTDSVLSSYDAAESSTESSATSAAAAEETSSTHHSKAINTATTTSPLGTTSATIGSATSPNNGTSTVKSTGTMKASTGVTLAELARTERMMWSLVTASDELAPAVVPDRYQAAECMKYYRRVLHLSQWKPDSLANKQNSEAAMLDFVGMSSNSRNDNFSRSLDDPANENESDLAATGMLENASQVALEVDEFFCVVNLLSVIGKALVWAYKAKQKKQQQQQQQLQIGATTTATTAAASIESPLSFQQLAQFLTVGNKSDLANSILGSLGSCTYLWRRRFDRGLMSWFRLYNQLLLQRAVTSQAGDNSSRSNSRSISSSSNNHSSAPTTVDNSAATNSTAAAANATARAQQAQLELQLLQSFACRFMLQPAPSVPCAAVFNVLSAELTLPPNVQGFITRLFTR